MAGGFFQAADDMVRLAANGLTFGAADKIAAALGEENSAQKTAAAAQRAGVAGDAVQVLGFGGGAKALFQTGMPVLRAVPKVAKAAFSKKGALLAGLGIGTAAQFNARTEGSAAPAAKAATPAKPQAKAQAKPAANNQAANKVASTIADIDNSPPTFASLAQQVAASQGGKISLNQLGALADIAQRSYVKPAKLPSAKDAAGAALMESIEGTYQRSLAAAQAKIEAGDIAGGQADAAATEEWRRGELTKLLGGDPVMDAIAARLTAAQGEDDE